MQKDKDIFDHLNPRKIEVPDSSYFEQLTKRVIAEEKKIIPLYRKPITWISLAAASIAVILTINLLITNDGSEDALLALNDCSTETIQSYVEENIEEFETEMIIEFIPVDNLDTPEVKEETESTVEEQETLTLEDVNTQDILDYFEEYEIDPYDIEEDESFI